MEPISIHLGWSMFAGVVIGVAIVLLIKANNLRVPVINPEPDATPEPAPAKRDADAVPRPVAPKSAPSATGQTYDEKVALAFSARLTQITDGLAMPSEQELRMARVVKRKLDTVLADVAAPVAPKPLA